MTDARIQHQRDPQFEGIVTQRSTQILVAHVDSDVCEIFVLALRHAGYAVRVAADPQRVTDEAADCALVITEYSTPPPHERPVTEALRADERTRSVKVLNATTYVLPSELEAARAAGVDATMVLPGSIAELITHVRALIGPAPEIARSASG